MEKIVMKKLSVALACTLLTITAGADIVLVDFGATNSLAPAGTVNGLYYNTWSPGQDVDLVLAGDGTTDSGWNMDSTSSAVAANNANTLDYVFTPNGAPDPFNDDAVFSDALNLTSAQGTRNVRFLNLDVNQTYNVTIFGAREATEVRTTDYSVIGASTVNGSLQTSGAGSGTGSNYNNDDVFTVSGMAPDANGRITIEYSTSSSFGYLSAVQLEVVPEPATLASMILGGLTLFLVRRRK